MTPQPPVQQAPPPDPLDFTDKYNTPIPPAKQPAFDQWAAQQTQQTGKDPRGDRYDYDVNGYFLSGAAQDPSGRGHGPDTFKKPNHPTFSDESQYNGVDGYRGGSWTPAGYRPSQTNLQFRPLPELQKYFNQVEPDTKLLAPAPPVPPYRVKPVQTTTPPQPALMPRRYYQPMADGAPPQDPQPRYNALKMAPDPEPTAQSRWTRTPIAFGQTYNTPDSNSASTLYNDANNQAVRIDANFGSDPVINNRMLRHESIHAALAGANRDQIAADPAVARAATPIMRTMRKAGYKGDINTELPAYMAAFSNDKGEWTGGVPVEQRNAYVDAYTKALARQNPQVAAKYQRMLVDSSPGTPASKVDLMPGPPPIGGQ